jgi:8-amino-7-oxononanoate synthase
VSTPFRNIESPIAAEITLDGRRYINFGGSSYLGLSANRDIIESGVETLRTTGTGYQFPRALNMATHAHQEVESEAAAFFGTPAAMYLSSGYHFGFAAMGALQRQVRVIFFDELAHFSLRDAIAASGLPSYPFRHADIGDLEFVCKRHVKADTTPLVVSDGMYAMYGEIAPLAELARVARAYAGKLLVDESHSFGVLGARGRGAVEHHLLAKSDAVIGGSLGKAFGACGGIGLGDEAQVAAFRATFVGRGASAGLAAAAAMCARSLRHVRERPELLLKLRANIIHLKTGLRNVGLDVGDSVAPVATFVAGAASRMLELQENLMQAGIYVPHVKYLGTGHAGVMRCGIFADHSVEHLDALLSALERLL